MATVVERASKVSQPYGGYIPLKSFERVSINDEFTLNVDENVDGQLIGSAVEYLTRFLFMPQDNSPISNMLKAFDVSLRGAAIAREFFGISDAVDVYREIFARMAQSDREGIITNACKLVTFDAWYRNPLQAVPNAYKTVNPDKATIENIHIMLKRSVSFFRERGGIVQSGFDFAPYGYTSTVSNGDGDFLTADTLWDMKVYRASTKITKKQTLQVLMYWIMGQHSGQEVFKSITKIGLYNPRMNAAYILDVSKIPQDIIREVEDKVICY